MDGLSLLTEARRAGLDVRAEHNRLVIKGPRRLEALARKLLDAKPFVLRVLEAEQTIEQAAHCSRCHTTATRLVLAYWSDSLVYCPACCRAVAAELDASAAWPAAPDVAGEAETYLRAPQG